MFEYLKLNSFLGVAILASLFILPIFFYKMPYAAAATNFYVRQGATGNGTSWGNAYGSLPATLQRGATYYIADGDYGSYTFDDPVSDTQTITIKKATNADHGGDTGWNAAFGDGSANWSFWKFMTGYYVLDGQVGQGAGSLYGVPSSAGWMDYIPYGFRVVSSVATDNAKLINIQAGGSSLVLRHLEAAFTNTPGSDPAWGQSEDIFYSVTGADGLTLSYTWLHDAGRVQFLMNGNDILVEYSVIERNGHGAAAGGADVQHSEFYSGDHNNNITFRYNLLRDWRSTGGLILHNDNSLPPPITNFFIYGNVFTTTGYWGGKAGDDNGVVNSLSDSVNTTVWVYNNSFVNIAYGCSVLSTGSYVTAVVQNNLFYNCKHLSGTGAAVGGSHNYNWYYNSGTVSETNVQNATAEPFVDLNAKNYRLKTATSAGQTLTMPYVLDPDNRSRGSDGVWDRGAYEFVSGSSVTPIVGDINLDHIVNAIDGSILNSDWFTSNTRSDLNHDGMVNAIDFSILNSNWFKTW